MRKLFPIPKNKNTESKNEKQLERSDYFISPIQKLTEEQINNYISQLQSRNLITFDKDTVKKNKELIRLLKNFKKYPVPDDVTVSEITFKR